MNHHLSPAGAAARHTVSDSVRVSVTRPTRDRGLESGRDGGPPHARTAETTPGDTRPTRILKETTYESPGRKLFLYLWEL